MLRSNENNRKKDDAIKRRYSKIADETTAKTLDTKAQSNQNQITQPKKNKIPVQNGFVSSTPLDVRLPAVARPPVQPYDNSILLVSQYLRFSPFSQRSANDFCI
jgi:hypothetical protein